MQLQNYPSKPLWQVFLATSLGVFLAFLSAAAIFEFRSSGRLIFASVDELKPALRPAARAVFLGDNNSTESQVTIVSHASKNTHTKAGKANVILMKFDLRADKKTYLKSLNFTLDRMAHAYDLKALQLYVKDVLVAETPFFEWHGIFQNLLLKFDESETVSIEIRGSISDQANAGDRIRLLLDGENALEIMEENGKKLNIKTGFPLKGNVVSVIGHEIETIGTK